jgi:hypothetical protein
MPEGIDCAETVTAGTAATAGDVFCGASVPFWLFRTDSYAILTASLPRGGPLSTELFGTQMVAGAPGDMVYPGLLISTNSAGEFLSVTARVPAQAVRESITDKNKKLCTRNELSSFAFNCK